MEAPLFVGLIAAGCLVVATAGCRRDRPDTAGDERAASADAGPDVAARADDETAAPEGAGQAAEPGEPAADPGPAAPGEPAGPPPAEPAGRQAAEPGGATGAADTAAETGSEGAAAAAPGEPEWMRVDEAGRTVELEVVAGLDPTNGNWNFNGYADGDMTITVPAGWSVVLRFRNQDANVPHSVYVSDEQPPFPSVVEGEAAIPRAYSINVQNGIAAGKEDVLRFTARDAGKFTMPCGVPGHAASGMWDWFLVSADAERPSVSVES